MSSTKFLKREFRVVLRTVGGLSSLQIVGSAGQSIDVISAHDEMEKVFDRLEGYCRGTIDEIEGL